MTDPAPSGPPSEPSPDDIAGVIARPPLLFLGALALGLLIEWIGDRLGWAWPLVATDRRPAVWIAGGLLIAAGIAILAAGLSNFGRAGTPVPTNQPTQRLVTGGIHGRSRNPIYVGLFATYLGIGITANIAWILLLALPLAAVMRYGVVAREEAYLERRFGADYRAYKARVRRWL